MSVWTRETSLFPVTEVGLYNLWWQPLLWGRTNSNRQLEINYPLFLNPHDIPSGLYTAHRSGLSVAASTVMNWKFSNKPILSRFTHWSFLSAYFVYWDRRNNINGWICRYLLKMFLGGSATNRFDGLQRETVIRKLSINQTDSRHI